MIARDYEIVEERFNINVNVFGYENKIFPLYVSKKSNEQVLNVLLISNDVQSHYAYIKDFNRLMYSEVKTKNVHKKHFCMSCLQNFTTIKILNNQIIDEHFNKKLKMTLEDENNYQNSKDCWICNQKINKDKDKVRDHCHITSKCRVGAHNECNSKLKTPKDYQLFFII